VANGSEQLVSPRATKQNLGDAQQKCNLVDAKHKKKKVPH